MATFVYETEMPLYLRMLYKSEVNIQISSDWDAGWTVKIGDIMNGFRFSTTDKELGRALGDAIDFVLENSSQSLFAKWWNS